MADFMDDYVLLDCDDVYDIDLTGFITIKKKGVEYYNVSCAFDIETTSFYYDNKQNIQLTNEEYKKLCNKNPKYMADKRAIMYVWQFQIEKFVFIGRTWGEFKTFINKLSSLLMLNEKRVLTVYVHNLSYEFQFIRKHFDWTKIFATEERKPLYAQTCGICFKCSYRLSGYSLSTVGKNLQKYKVEKKEGDLDYKKIRNSKTKLTDDELGYCINDTRVVVSYIKEQIERYGNITNIPLTQTGVVRRFVRSECFKNKNYKLLMKKLTLTPIEYMSLQRAFAGGFTHANAMYTTQICDDVTSYDFTSSYPAVLCAEQFPMSRGRLIPSKDLSRENMEKLLNNYCCLFDIEIYGLKPRYTFENIISRSKCFICDNAVLNNGRVVKADKIGTTITDVDFRMIQEFYSWDYFIVNNFYIYERGYLPREFLGSVLKLYSDKTTLKGVEGKEVEYLHAKEMLNSCYGMTVTSIVRNMIDYSGDEWQKVAPELDSEIEEYNKDRNRFLFYPWGVWCTSYARRNLYMGILECKDDYIYSDTDSIKIFNVNKHIDFINKYNEAITLKLEYMCKYYGFSYELIQPKTIKGETKPLGVWDFDGHYKHFKTLGAKRYLILDDDDNYHLTVAGLNKKVALPFLIGKETNYKKVFNKFNDGLVVDSDNTGKMLHTYLDYENEGMLIDYEGNEEYYKELSSIHLENAEYSLSLTGAYIDYLLGIRMV